MIHAYAYLRVSSKGQLDGDGLTRQRETVARFAAAHDFEIVRWFEDGAVRGVSELADRPAMSDMAEALASNGVKTVLVECADRLARQLMVSELILDQMRKLGVTVIACDCGADLTNDDEPTRVLIRQVVAAVAEFNKSQLVSRLREARQRRRRETGRCEGGRPYGSLPGEQETLDRIARRDRQGMSARDIAEELNLRIIRSRSGKRWSERVVRRIVNRLNASPAVVASHSGMPDTAPTPQENPPA